MKHIVCFHLLNDYSGSPKVLKIVLEELLKQGYEIDLITSGGGVLESLKSYKNLNYVTYCYRFSEYKFITLIRYVLVQILTFLYSFKYIFRKDIVFYINTIMPVGPALAGCLMGKKCVYHYHEQAAVKGGLYRTLCRIMQAIATEIICVSRYQRSFLRREHNVSVISNALPKDFTDSIIVNIDDAYKRNTVLMLSSLKVYKGIPDYFKLARDLPDIDFDLVINDTQDHIDEFLKQQGISVTPNITVFSRQTDVSKFYNRASIVLNLSNKKLFVETFGMTALEAMSVGLPIIVPTEGGISELIVHNVSGFKIDVQELDKIKSCIRDLLRDEIRYTRIAENALMESQKYSVGNMCKEIMEIIEK